MERGDAHDRRRSFSPGPAQATGDPAKGGGVIGGGGTRSVGASPDAAQIATSIRHRAHDVCQPMHYPRHAIVVELVGRVLRRVVERIPVGRGVGDHDRPDRKSTRLNSSHTVISYAVFCLKKKNQENKHSKPQALTYT